MKTEDLNAGGYYEGVCSFCGGKTDINAGPSGVFHGCMTYQDQADPNSYCPGYWELNPAEDMEAFGKNK